MSSIFRGPATSPGMYPPRIACFVCGAEVPAGKLFSRKKFFYLLFTYLLLLLFFKFQITLYIQRHPLAIREQPRISLFSCH